MQDLGDERAVVPLPLQPAAEQVLFDVPVVLTARPVTEVAVSEEIPEERNDPLLGPFL